MSRHFIAEISVNVTLNHNKPKVKVTSLSEKKARILAMYMYMHRLGLIKRLHFFVERTEQKHEIPLFA